MNKSKTNWIFDNVHGCDDENHINCGRHTYSGNCRICRSIDVLRGEVGPEFGRSKSDAIARNLPGYSTRKLCKIGDHARIQALSRGKGCLQCALDDRTTVRTRDDARARGQTYYNVGTPCTHGHVGARYVSSNNCVDCTRYAQDGGPTPPDVPAQPIRIISRDDARAQGESRYFTGNPCTRGHDGVRYVSNNICVECQSEQRSGIRRGGRIYPPAPTAPVGISRTDARAAGFTRYFTGTPCLHGHISPRYVSSSICVECQSEQRSGIRRPDARVDPPTAPAGISRTDARAAGFTRYSTGNPCTYGHTSSRYVSSGRCVDCSTELNRGLPRPPKQSGPTMPPAPAGIKRRDARTAGFKRYTGNPCTRGHDGIRWTSTGNCVECRLLTPP